MTSLRSNWGGATALPLNLIAQAIPRLSRSDLEALSGRLIDRIDEIDGDCYLEDNGDELDGTGGEDDFCKHPAWQGQPGCPISDRTTTGSTEQTFAQNFAPGLTTGVFCAGKSYLHHRRRAEP